LAICSNDSSDGRAHRTAHELELERARDDRLAVQRSGHDDQRIPFARRLLRLLEPVAVLLTVAKLERILGFDLGGEFHARLRVEKRL
jgi:hypothetical protein